jgi:hypothetical protein
MRTAGIVIRSLIVRFYDATAAASYGTTMTSLLDLGPLTEDVPIGDKKLIVHGVSAGDLFYLLAKFSDVRKLMDGRRDEVDGAALTALAPEVLAEVIACACRMRGNAQALAVAAGLGADYQLAVVDAAMRLTFPRGAGPFVEALDRIKKMVSLPGVEPVTRSPGRPSAQLQTDSDGIVPGRARRAS